MHSKVAVNTGGRRWAVIAATFLILAASAPAVASPPPADPPLTLAPEEKALVESLQSAVEFEFWGDISPDDAAIPIAVYDGLIEKLAILHLDDGTLIEAQGGVDPLSAATELRWRDDGALVFIAAMEPDPVMGSEGELWPPAAEPGATPVGSSPTPPVDDPMADPDSPPLAESWELLAIDRETGAVTSTPLDLPGRPFSLDPRGERLLVTVPPVTVAAEAAGERIDVIDLATMAATPVVTMPAGSVVPDRMLTGLGFGAAAWTDDGARLALLRTAAPPAWIYEIDPDAFVSPFRLSDNEVQDALGQLAPKENPFFQMTAIELVAWGPADGGDDTAPRHVATLSAPLLGPDVFGGSRWSADGEILAVKTLQPSRISGRPHPLYQAEFPESSAWRFFTADGEPLGALSRPHIDDPYARLISFAAPDDLMIQATQGSDVRLFAFDDGDRFAPLEMPDGSIQAAVAPGSGDLLFLHHAFDQPPEVYRQPASGGEPIAVTSLNAEAAAASAVRADRVAFTLEDGTERPGYLVQPEGAAFPPRDIPIVVWQEGGPGGPMLNAWSAVVEAPATLLPNLGQAVLVVPLSGRTGHGAAFHNALYAGDSFGQKDIDEMAEIVAQMMARGWTNPGQVGITGCSYGGYFAAQSIVRHPALYAAANPQCSLLDLLDGWNDDIMPLIAWMTGGVPFVDADEYLADSPVYGAGRIRTPLLIFHNPGDSLPIGSAWALHDQVAANGIPVDLIAFPDEGHGIGDPAHQLTAAQAQAAWFRTFLEPAVG